MINKRKELTRDQIDEIGLLVEGRISTSTSVLDQHSRDESAFPASMPSAVVFPNSTEEVSKLLRYCNDHEIPVVAFGAGSSLEGHVVPVFGGISLDLSGMNKVLGVSPDDLLVRVEAGVHRIALGEKLADYGLFFPVDPGADATLGGMASTGAAGTMTVRYGAMKENVLALTVVLADGTIIHTGRDTRKLSAGYDLTRLLIGSEGTLGVITELTLRIFGIPERMAAAIVSFPNMNHAVEAATDVVRCGIPIARCEFLDQRSIRNINAYESLNLAAVPTLFFEFHGSPESVREDAFGVQEIVVTHDGSDFEWSADETQRRELWRARHGAHFAAMASNPGMKKISTDVAVPLSKLSRAVKMAEELLTENDFVFSILGHVADGNFHCQIIVDPNDSAELTKVREVVNKLSFKVIDLGGTCTGEHGIGGGKIEALEIEAGEALSTMRTIKLALDPKGILNPGKIFR